MNPVISLVSGTYNRLPILAEMVQSFRDNLLPGLTYEIVLVDGGSTDGTIEWAKQQSDVRLIEDGALLGAINAFTRGAHAAVGKYVLLANDDILFKPNSIIPAIVHLENNMRCGAIAYRDNRPMQAHQTRKDYKVSHMAASRPVSAINRAGADYRKVFNLNGVDYLPTSVVYAQVGLFRKWLGDKCNWWTGEHDEMIKASTYAGDNSLSAQIWHYGYTVDEVPECVVEDHVTNDELRQINYHKGVANDDSKYFYQQWPQGVIVNDEPQMPQQDRRSARILYLPIYEPGWSVQKHPVHGKHGLRDALSKAKNKYGASHIVQEFDYLSVDPKRLRSRLVEIADSFKPDLILTQLQSPLPITADMLTDLKQRTGASVVNWNGDQAIGGLYSQQMLPLLHQIDLQLITNLDVVADYEREHIKWAYWQIGYEESADDDHTQQVADTYYAEQERESPFSSDPHWPVVFLASLRSPERQAISAIVQEFGGRCFNPGDEFASLYNFSVTKAIYRRAKVIISDNGFTSRGFVSNRLFQALAAGGGGVVLQQHVDGLDELTGLRKNDHYIEWMYIDDLRGWLKVVLEEDVEPAKKIAQRGTAFVRANFSFDVQVTKLTALIKEHLGESEQLASSVALRYTGRSQFGFGLGNSFPSNQRYEFQPGKLLYVKREDLATLLQWYPNQWEVIES